MISIIRRANAITVCFSNGETLTVDPTEEMADKIESFKNCDDNQEVILKEWLYNKLYGKSFDCINRVKNSHILTLRGNSIYMLSVSQLSIPEDFALKILNAEESKDTDEINKWINFWTLVSLNPDSRVRNNLFWFIRKWDMQISQSGLIIGYRNVRIKEAARYSSKKVKEILNTYYTEKYINHRDTSQILFDDSNLEAAYNYVINEGGSPTYTDVHSGTFNIKLGQPVSMPRENCDAEQENSCSRGLHIGAKSWLKNNYYGEVGLQCLINPANVVAIPTIDNYGKMRCCEYLPVRIIDYDDRGNVIEPAINIYDDINYFNQLKSNIYNGIINNNDIDNYEVSHGDISRENLYNNILQRLNDSK